MKKRLSGRMGKRGFLAGALPGFLVAPLTFLLVALFFYFFFSWSAEAKLRALEDVKDVAYGNYLAQVYLRTPLKVGGQDMTVAELISFYDYNQSLENAKNRSYATFVADNIRFIMGHKNPMRDSLVSITDDFVDRNFDDDRCFTFSIHSDAIDLNYRSSACPGARAFSIYYLFSQMRNINNATFATYVAPVDPRAKPIVVYSVFDMERLLDLYSDDPYFDMSAASQWAVGALCVSNPAAAIGLSYCRERHGAAIKEAVS